MKYIVYLIAVIFLLGINLGVFGNLPIKGQIPNLLFLLTIFFALEKNDYDFFFIALISGIFLDFYSAGFFGAFSFGLLLVALSLHFFVSSVLVVEINYKSLTLVLLLCLLLFNLALWFYGFLSFKFHLFNQPLSFRVLAASFPVSFFYDWLLLYPMYLMMNFLKGVVGSLNIRRRGLVR